MFVGKDNDLDPSINNANHLQPPLLDNTLRLDSHVPSNSTATQSSSQTTQQSNSQTKIHKIPDSELEGIDLPIIRDALP
jgi:hypothetical protein